jgi:hypothetical protein
MLSMVPIWKDNCVVPQDGSLVNQEMFYEIKICSSQALPWPTILKPISKRNFFQIQNFLQSIFLWQESDTTTSDWE